MFRTLTSFLRQFTFQKVYGIKTPDGVRPSLTKEHFIDRINSGRYPHQLNNEEFAKHRSGITTNYFFGSPYAEYSLAKIDIDVSKSMNLGTTEGAIAFAEHLKAELPGLYCEPSTHGKGIHCYPLIKHEGSAQRLNQAIEQLERWARNEAKGFDIELVEVKGKAPLISYDQGKIVGVKYGTFAKFPRQATLEDLQGTAVITWQELHRINGKFSVPDQPKKARVHKGSGCTFIDDDFVDLNLWRCRKTWESMLGGEILKGSRWLVNDDDGEAFLLIALWFQEHGNKESAFSLRTMVAFWDDLYDRGFAKRSCNHHRIKAMRDWLSSRGAIDWVDNKYQPPSKEDADDGICCKWRLDSGFALLIIQGGDNVDTAFRGRGENLQPRLSLIREQAKWDQERWLHEIGEPLAERILIAA